MFIMNWETFIRIIEDMYSQEATLNLWANKLIVLKLQLAHQSFKIGKRVEL